MQALILRRFAEPAIATLGLALLAGVAMLIPGHDTSSATAPSTIFVGAVNGLVVALTAVALVLVYQSIRIINFAQLALGVTGATICFDVIQLSGMPFPVALLIGLGLGVATGAGFHLVFGTRFGRSPRVVLTLMTVFAGTAISQEAGGLLNNLPFLPPPNLRPIEQISGQLPLRPFLPFPGWHFTIGGYPVGYGFPEVFAAATAVVALIALVVFLRRSRVGKAIRAMAENSERAELLGISVNLMSLTVWMIAGGLSVLAAMLVGFESRPAQVTTPIPGDILLPLAAAVLARMRNLWTAVATTVGLSVVSAAVLQQWAAVQPMFDLGLFLLLVGGLLLRGRSLSRKSEEATSWQGTAEVRPIPREMASLPLLRVLKWGGIAVAVVALVAAPVFLSVGTVQSLGVIFLTGVVALSVVMLTGWAGQASFAQFALAAVGALTAASLASKLGLNFWLAVPIATAITVVLAVLMAFPALRIRGLFLIAVTFAFAVTARSLLFDPTYFGWLQPGPVGRPSLFLIDFSDDRYMYGLAALTLVAAIVIMRNLRRSRFGRLVIAVRENEASVEASGVSGVRTKLAVFATAGAFAGFAGALLAFDQFGVNGNSYGPEQSINVFEMVVVGGAASAWGGLLGVGVIYGVSALAQGVPGVATVVLPALPAILLYIAPSGLLGVLLSARDGILRILAQRNQMVVASLYGELDAEALHLRLIPLAVAIGNGLGTGFRLSESRLSAARVEGANAAQARESAALAAARRSAAEEAG